MNYLFDFCLSFLLKTKELTTKPLHTYYCILIRNFLPLGLYCTCSCNNGLRSKCHLTNWLILKIQCYSASTGNTFKIANKTVYLQTAGKIFKNLKGMNVKCTISFILTPGSWLSPYIIFTGPGWVSLDLFHPEDGIYGIVTDILRSLSWCSAWV